MKFAELPTAEHWNRLRLGNLYISIGHFRFRFQSNLRGLIPLLSRMYADYRLPDRNFADLHISFMRRMHWLRPWQPQVQFFLGDKAPFQPFPRDTALPFLEWGINWCIATHAHHYLMLHAGVVERNNQALILPAWPGSGKSTLSAALCQRGWRLLSDEFGLVQPKNGLLAPFPRLVALKNESIAVIRDFAPDAVMGPEYPKTRKGTVCHLRPPTDSIERDQELAKPRWIVFPKYRKGASMNLRSIEKTEAFVTLSGHSFNYDLIGLRGFQTLANLIDACDCYTFEYGGDLEQAVAQLNALAEGLI